MEAATLGLGPPSFEEDTYIVSNLSSSEKKALQEIKAKLAGLFKIPPPPFIWGVDLLSGSDRADVVLLKFLRARDFKVGDSLLMLRNCLAWRQEFKADGLAYEEEDPSLAELEGVVTYMHARDRCGRPVCYNAYAAFKDPETYDRFLGDDEKLNKFLRWRVQVLEKGIRLLDLKPCGVNSIIQITDLKDMPKKRQLSNRILSLFQDNYPELVARKIFINVPWYFSLLYSMFSPFLTQRTKSKFVMCKEGDVAETLYKFIRPDDIPVQYGGLSRHNSPSKPASEFTVRGGEKVNIQIEGIEVGSSIAWDLVAGGWDVDYSVEFVPNAHDSYTIAVEKLRRVAAEEEAIHNSFTPKEAGRLVISVDNTSSRKKKVAAYRYIVQKRPTN
uniref:Patellin-6 n=1 Tax=Kalanchoe fedtschenkoi TaxID=63787 RepID=A0A7N0T3L4_KALFE